MSSRDPDLRQSDVPTLRDYVRVLERWKWLILLISLAAPIVTLLLSFQQPALYQASSEVLVKREDPAAEIAGVQSNSREDPERLIATQAALAQTPPVAKDVLQEVGIDYMTPEDFLEDSKVEGKGETDILEFTVTARGPDLAAQLATEYARKFTEYRQELDTAALTSARKDLEATIADLQQRSDASPGLYAELVSRLQELRAREALETQNAVVVRGAEEATQVQPRPLRNAVLALGLGLILGVVLAFVADALDARVRSPEDVAERLRLPLLARVPPMQRQIRKQNLLSALDDPSGPQAEALRLLRANLGLLTPAREVRSILFTSAAEGEGKSTTVANLAILLARTGWRIALVDLDLRRPSLHRLFRLGPRPGVTDFALGRVEFEDALVPIALAEDSTEGRSNGYGRAGGGLEVFPAGRVVAEASDFFTGAALATLVERLSGRADLVLIDAPALLGVSDTVVLTSKADAIVFVVKMDRARKRMLDEARELLNRSPAAKLGFVATGVKPELDYGYGYSPHIDAPEERDEARGGLLRRSQVRKRLAMPRRTEEIGRS
jgi:polysaccharide biosynthesis transport protein